MITIVQSAKYFQSGCSSNRAQKETADGRYDVIQPVIIDIGGIRLSTPAPKSARDAMFYNEAIGQFVESQQKP